jgi:hypothetical protein
MNELIKFIERVFKSHKIEIKDLKIEDKPRGQYIEFQCRIFRTEDEDINDIASLTFDDFDVQSNCEHEDFDGSSEGYSIEIRIAD